MSDRDTDFYWLVNVSKAFLVTRGGKCYLSSIIHIFKNKVSVNLYWYFQFKFRAQIQRLLLLCHVSIFSPYNEISGSQGHRG